MPTWHLGPVGALTQIPAPARDLDVSPELVGGVHTSLGGVVTVDRVAQPRRWPLTWPALTEDQATYLRLVGQGIARGPLRLVDPEIRNRLPVNISAGGSYDRTAADFTQTGGSTPTWLAITDPPSSVPTRGVVSWQRTTTAAGVLTTTNTADRVPLITSEQVRVSLWARGAAIQASVGLDAYNTAGSSARTLGTATSLNATTWTQLTVLYTPPSDRVELAPLLNVASGQAASTLQTTGWMVSPSAASTTWAPGGGAPVVVAGSELAETYILTGLREFRITLLEAAM